MGRKFTGPNTFPKRKWDPTEFCLQQNSKQSISINKHYAEIYSLNPIWTLQTGSLFIMSIDAKELFAGDGLFCRVLDYDVLSSDDLGYFVVPPDLLYKGNGEREVFKLKAPPRSKGEVPGYVAIRCRRATQYDKEFMKEFESSAEAAKADTVSAATTSEGGKSNLKSIIETKVKVDKSGVRKVRRLID
jgi:hypothetical protein